MISFIQILICFLLILELGAINSSIIKKKLGDPTIHNLTKSESSQIPSKHINFIDLEVTVNNERFVYPSNFGEVRLKEQELTRTQKYIL